MTRSVYREARAVGACADGKIRRLQSMYLSGTASASEARATLARLRRPGHSSRWMVEGAVLLRNLPELDLTERGERRMMSAIRVALELYAWHQQSRTVPMAYTTQEDGRRRSFGASCRLIERDLDAAAGVRRKLAAVESASGLEEMEHQLRGLVTLMRSENVQVDYRVLTEDLYLLQGERTRESVLMRWSRDYYADPRDLETPTDR